MSPPSLWLLLSHDESSLDHYRHHRGVSRSNHVPTPPWSVGQSARRETKSVKSPQRAETSQNVAKSTGKCHRKRFNALQTREKLRDVPKGSLVITKGNKETKREEMWEVVRGSTGEMSLFASFVHFMRHMYATCVIRNQMHLIMNQMHLICITMMHLLRII